MNKKIILFGCMAFLALGAKAQKTAGGYFNGTARAVVDNRTVLDTAGVNDGATTGGYTLFDLGINAVRNDVIKASSILRVKNEFGGFFGDGVSFEFRQLTLEGLIGEKLKYQIGDLDLVQTEYTLFNNNIGFNQYESELFSMKRDIIDYENFYTDKNTWRTQGVNLYTTLLFDKVIDKVKLRAHGNRIEGADVKGGTGTPDRFMYGGDVRVIKDKSEIGFHTNNVQDLAKTLASSIVDYDNHVYTTNFKVLLPVMDGLEAGVSGEAGVSDMKMRLADSTVTRSGGFADVGIVAAYKPYGINLRAGYRQVDANFTSPGAQTRRIYGVQQATRLFGFDANSEINPFGIDRLVTGYDRLSQETGLYNSKTLSTQLMAYNPVYGNALPYGKATPNRKGLSVELLAADSAKIYNVTANFHSLSEINPLNVAIVDADLREFTVLQVGGVLNVHNLTGKQNTLAFSAGFNSEKTTRGGVSSVDFTTTSIDAGVDFEPFKRLHFLAGYKSVIAKGNEFVVGNNTVVTDEFNNYLAGLDTKFDVKDNIVSVGAKFNFSDNTFFSVQGNFTTYDGTEHFIDNPSNTWNYSMNQVYFLYSQKF